MKIVFITHYNELYGANRSLLNLIDALLNNQIKRNQIHVILPEEGKFSDQLTNKSIAHTSFIFDMDWTNRSSIRSILAKKRRIRYRINQKEKLRDIIQELNPDVIHSNSSVFLAGAYIAKKLKIPHIWHVREDIENHYNRVYDSKKSFLELMRYSSSVICTSTYIQKLLASQGIINTTILYNIVENPSSMNLKPKFRDFTFGVVGRIHESKNQEFIYNSLRSFLSKNKNVRLMFFGTGDEEITNKLKTKIKNDSLVDQVLLAGFRDNIDEIYNSISVLINCSENEAFGRVNLEAYARKIPVIGLKSGATEELILDNQTGILIDKKPNELKEACNRFIEHDDLRTSMGVNAYNLFKQISNEDTFAAKLLDIYNLALKNS